VDHPLVPVGQRVRRVGVDVVDLVHVRVVHSATLAPQRLRLS
jgi:hypothetical protein